MHGLQALAQDQLRALRQMCAAAFGDDAPHVEVYDGDTTRVIPPLHLFGMLPLRTCSTCLQLIGKKMQWG